MAGNKSLNAAAQAKQDEFYTQLSDIEKELRHYKHHFQGKTVFCNCDDPYESNFFKYFVLNFNKLGLKKLMATCYAGSPISGTQLSISDVIDTHGILNTPYKAIVTTVYDKTGDGGVDMFDVAELFKSGENELSQLEGDGDFQSEECLSLLVEADIIVTNPPFSQFREYIACLMEHGKQFLIIGSQNNVTYKEVFPLLQSNKVWLGYKAGDMSFAVPDYYEPRATRYWQDENGQKWRSMGNICWFTNLDIKKRHEELILVKHYSPELYPNYYNYDAIEVSKITDIPCDYSGAMGVPITFLDKYNPEQFEIIGVSSQLASPIRDIAKPGTYQTGGPQFYSPRLTEKDKENGFLIHREYDRIVIRNKHPEGAGNS